MTKRKNLCGQTVSSLMIWICDLDGSNIDKVVMTLLMTRNLLHLLNYSDYLKGYYMFVFCICFLNNNNNNSRIYIAQN